MVLLYHKHDTTAIKIRNYNHMGKRAFIVTQSIKKLKAEDKEWALNPVGFKTPATDCHLLSKVCPLSKDNSE